MANVNLKTDFKDGEFLYADQLKNNFEAIQAALNAMNAIVWQDNADKVVTFRGTTEELMNREIIDGQILYDTTTGESYIDYLGRRISTGSGNAIHIGETEPSNPSTQIWINRDDLSAVGSEVVNSLEGNEERMAPSVATVNKAFGNEQVRDKCSLTYIHYDQPSAGTIAALSAPNSSITFNQHKWSSFDFLIIEFSTRAWGYARKNEIIFDTQNLKGSSMSPDNFYTTVAPMYNSSTLATMQYYFTNDNTITVFKNSDYEGDDHLYISRVWGVNIK